METNIRRVFIHHFFKNQKAISDKQILKLVKESLPVANFREWYWALMDYGAHLGVLRVNPNHRSRHYVRQAAFKGSRREVRGKVLKLLQAGERVTISGLKKLFPMRAGEIQAIVAELEHEGFVRRRGATICLSGESAR